MNRISYKSTRGGEEIVGSAGAIKQGIAQNGGLFMPAAMPKKFTCGDISQMCGMDYAQRAVFVLSRFLTDYTEEELTVDCADAYSELRFPGGAAPLVTLDDNVSILELWHGPTCAFKDMALQIMPKLLSRSLDKTGEKRDAFILVATSGDTGKAALEGYRDAKRVKIMVFYPVDGVSRVQKLQMATQEGSNVEVRSVTGNFDDTQNGVKRIFADKAAAQELAAKGYFLSSANSINWGRLAPQIVYYFSAYCDMVNHGNIKCGDKIDFCVPTGNFGNIFAGYLAKNIGLPVEKFICASNQNNILTDFFRTGTYDRNRDFYTTTSPSMDILISSNLERLLYVIGGSEKTAEYMDKLAKTGRYTVSPDVKATLDREFYGEFCTEEECGAQIKATWETFRYLIDPHTAVGTCCAKKYLNAHPGRIVVCLSTASPYKFASSVYHALTGGVSEDEFENIRALSALTDTMVPEPLAKLQGKKIRFDPDKPIKAEDMKTETVSV